MSYAELFWLASLSVLAVFVLPLVLVRSDVLQRRLYTAWREGASLKRNRDVPRRARKWKQLSIRGILLLMTVAALFVSYLQETSSVSGFFLGLGCVLTGILIGIDYEPRGIHVLRGYAMSGVCGGLVGVMVFAVFLTMVHVTSGKALTTSWFWDSLGRLTLIWTCFAVFAGVAIGSWAAMRPFRELASQPTNAGDSDRKHIEHSSEDVQVDKQDRKRIVLGWVNYLPAVLCSLLIHITIVSLQAGFFDIGTKMDSQQGQLTSDAIEIVASMTEPEDDVEPDLNSVQIEDDGDLATDETAEASAPLELQQSDEEADVESNNNANMVATESDPLLEASESGQGALGANPKPSYRIPLNGETVHFRSKVGGITFRGVTELRLFADGKRVRAEVDNDGFDPTVGFELALKYMSVEFQAEKTKLQLPPTPYANVASTITSNPLKDGEARIQIGGSTVLRRNQFPARTVAGSPRMLEGRKPSAFFQSQGASISEAEPQTEPIKGVMLDGRCPVHLIEKGRWEKGDPEVRMIVDGWVVRFSNEAAREKFRSNPSQYMPVSNGLDVVVATNESKAVQGTRRYGVLYDDDDAGPNMNRMYLFSSVETRNDFERNPDRYLAALKMLDKNKLRTGDKSKASIASRSTIREPIATRQDIASNEKTAAGVVGRNLLKNGDFESRRPSSDSAQLSIITGNTTNAIGWGVSDGQAWMKYRRDSSDKLLDQHLLLMDRGTVYQTFATIPGMRYELSFRYTHHPDERTNAKIESGVVRVLGETKLLEKAVTPKPTRHQFGKRLNFEKTSLKFVADGTETRLEFGFRDEGGLPLIIDDVRVIETLY